MILFVELVVGVIAIISGFGFKHTYIVRLYYCQLISPVCNCLRLLESEESLWLYRSVVTMLAPGTGKLVTVYYDRRLITDSLEHAHIIICNVSVRGGPSSGSIMM